MTLKLAGHEEEFAAVIANAIGKAVVPLLKRITALEQREAERLAALGQVERRATELERRAAAAEVRLGVAETRAARMP